MAPNLTSEKNYVRFSGGFTVLMATYAKDDPALLTKAVESVFQNDYLPDDFILVIDGPLPPPLKETVQQLQINHPLRTIPLQENGGLAKALNAGLKESNTDWIVRADSDDINLPNRFSSLAHTASETVNRLDLIGSSIIEVDPDGKKLAVRKTPTKHKDIVSFAATRNPFNHMSVAYKRELALFCGGYPDIHLKEDYGLWASMIKHGARCQNIDSPLVKATTGPDMYRRRGGLKYALAEMELQNHLFQCRLKSRSKALIHGFARATIFILPPRAREFIYLKLLRK